MEGTEKILPQAENQFNLRNIGKAIAKFKYWIIGASLIGAVGGYLFFRLGINSSREKLVSSFGYTINAKAKLDENATPLTNEELANATLYLSDSSVFSYTDIVSEPRLLAVQELNKDEFGSINVRSLAKNGGIKISRASYTEQTTNRVVYEYPARYTITASRSAFASEEQGRNFIRAVIDYELVVAKQANDNYEITDYLGNNSQLSYSQYVANLSSQYDAIDKCYQELVKTFDNSSIADADNNSLNKVYTNFIDKYSSGVSNIIKKYEGDLYHNHLVDYKTATVEALKSQAESYKENVRSNLITRQSYQKSLDALINVQVTNVETNSNIEKEIIKINKDILEIDKTNASYIKELINLGYTVPAEVSIDNVDLIKYEATNEGVIQSLQLGDAIWKAMCDQFKVDLDKTANSLAGDRKLAGDHYGFVNNRYLNQVNMYTSGGAELTGHISSFIGAGVGLIGLFVITTLVFTFVYIAKKEKYER